MVPFHSATKHETRRQPAVQASGPGPSHPTQGKADLLHAELAVHTVSAPRALPGPLSAGHHWAGAAVAMATVTLSAAHARRESSADKRVELLPEGKSRLCYPHKLPLRNRQLPAVRRGHAAELGTSSRNALSR
ncbi:hypothetical protein LEMLEM_LOCUS800 [Lemmus lemmus]